eukprot:UN25890
MGKFGSIHQYSEPNNRPNKHANRINAYTFTRVFNETEDNQTCYNEICKPLIANVLGGFNAVLIAYGQTGSGKTYSLLGKPKENIVGLLPRIMLNLSENKNVSKLELMAVEAYGVHVARIELFDLFSDDAKPTDWNDKREKVPLIFWGQLQ